MYMPHSRFEFNCFYPESYAKWYNFLFGFWSKWDACDTPDDDNHIGYRDLECIGIRLFGIELWYVRTKQSNSEYTCECGWHPPEESYYMAQDGNSSNMSEAIGVDEDNRTIIYKENPYNEARYPKYSDKQYSYWAAMEFGGTPYDWTETHYCPHCKTEFEFDSSNY